jgi:hypothetical protein
MLTLNQYHQLFLGTPFRKNVGIVWVSSASNCNISWHNILKFDLTWGIGLSCFKFGCKKSYLNKKILSGRIWKNIILLVKITESIFSFMCHWFSQTKCGKHLWMYVCMYRLLGEMNEWMNESIFNSIQIEKKWLQDQMLFTIDSISIKSWMLNEGP